MEVFAETLTLLLLKVALRKQPPRNAVQMFQKQNRSAAMVKCLESNCERVYF